MTKESIERIANETDSIFDQSGVIKTEFRYLPIEDLKKLLDKTIKNYVRGYLMGR